MLDYPGNPFAVMPELLFYARRASATRYIFLFPLFGPYAGAREKQVSAALEITRSRPAAEFYLPNELFDLPGRESYLAVWSFDYLHRIFSMTGGWWWMPPAFSTCCPPRTGRRRLRASPGS